jgi:hypothetical protein
LNLAIRENSTWFQSRVLEDPLHKFQANRHLPVEEKYGLVGFPKKGMTLSFLLVSSPYTEMLWLILA